MGRSQCGSAISKYRVFVLLKLPAYSNIIESVLIACDKVYCLDSLRVQLESLILLYRT